MQVVEGNVLDVERGIVLHQVNCQGVMGSGVALALREKYQAMYRTYSVYCQKNAPEDLLGKLQVMAVGPGLYIGNVFGQLGFGRQKMQTDYGAVANAMMALNAFLELHEGLPVYVPYLMGCDRAGGDWDAYSVILDLACDSPITALRLPV